VLVSEAKTALKRYGFDDSDPLLTWINAARAQIIDEHDWTWTNQFAVGMMLAAGDYTISLPNDSYAIETVVVRSSTSVRKLIHKDYQSFVDNYADQTLTNPSTGMPQFYSVYSGGQVIVWPTPDVDYSVDISYRMNFNSLVDDTDDLGIPSSLHYAVVLGAAYIALQAENEEERAQTAQAQFESRVSAAWLRDSRSATGLDSSDQVEDTQGYGRS
jgi:hypothetical protein